MCPILSQESFHRRSRRIKDRESDEKAELIGEMRPQAKEFWRSLEVGKGKMWVLFSLDSPKEISPTNTLIFTPVIFISDYLPSELRRNTFVLF